MPTPDLSPSLDPRRVVVQGVRPLSWRRLRVRSDLFLALLHDGLQIVFAWRDGSRQGFHIPSQASGSPRLGGPGVDAEPRHGPLAVRRVPRGEGLRYGDTLMDAWDGQLRLDALRPRAPPRRYPVWIGGQRAVPPEAWGGPWA